MNRRDWLRRATIIAGGAIAADQLELIERLLPRNYVAGWSPSYVTATEISISQDAMRRQIERHFTKIQREMFELFTHTNKQLEDLLWTEGNSFAGHPSLPRASLPLINWKSLSG